MEKLCALPVFRSRNIVCLLKYRCIYCFKSYQDRRIVVAVSFEMIRILHALGCSRKTCKRNIRIKSSSETGKITLDMLSELRSSAFLAIFTTSTQSHTLFFFSHAQNFPRVKHKGNRAARRPCSSQQGVR